MTNLLPADFQDFFQVLNFSNATTTVNELLEYSPDRIVCWVQVWAILRPLFGSTTSAMTSHRILITEEYLNARFFSVFLFCLCATSVKGVILCKFS